MAEKPGPSVGTGSSDAQTPFRCEDGPFTRLPTQREPETVAARVAATSPGRPAREDGPHSAHTRAHTVRACSHTSTRASMCTGTHMHAHARAHARRGTRADHARTCRLRAAHVRTSIRQVVTPWSRPAPARLPPQLRSCVTSTAFTVACPRTSEDVSKEPVRVARFSAAVGVYLLRIPAHSVASTRGNSDRVTAWNRTVARDWKGLFRGPPALAPGCAHLGPRRPLISNVPLDPQQGDCHEEGTGQVRLGGRLRAGPVISPSARTEVFLQEPRWAVREAGSRRARAGCACVRGAAGGGAGSQRRPWSFAGAHAERLPLSAAWCSHPRGANAGAPNTREKLRAQTRRFLRTGGWDGRGPRRLL